MRWEERLLAELDDLEQLAGGLHLAERDAVVAELSVSEYAQVELASRLHASVGAVVRLGLAGSTTAEGEVTRVGKDWLLLGRDRVETVVRLDAVLRVGGASARSVPEEARSVLARLALGSVLRQLGAERETLAITLTDGTIARGRLRRVGRDFVEVAGEDGRVELLGFAGLAMLRRG